MMPRNKKGSVVLLVLIFGGIFLGVLTSLAGYVLTLSHSQDYLYEKAEASSIAEAGINYYKWYLEQNPLDTSPLDPSTLSYESIAGGELGTYALNITPDTGCPGNIAFDISSLGMPSDAPSVHAVISMVYVPDAGSYATPPDCVAASSTSARFLDWQEQ